MLVYKFYIFATQWSFILAEQVMVEAMDFMLMFLLLIMLSLIWYSQSLNIFINHIIASTIKSLKKLEDLV